MKALAATAAVGLVMAVGGCARDVARPSLTRLDCPEAEGGLKRVSASADGRSCGYTSADGAEITLKLIPLAGGVDATLKAVEADLRAELAAAPLGQAKTAGEAGEAGTPAASTSSEAAAVIARAKADAAGSGDKAADADPDADPDAAPDSDWDAGADAPSGERTRVDLPGVHIVAEDDTANVRIGPLHIDAQGEGAAIRMQRYVRMRGEALSREKRGVSATFILAGDDLPGGYHFAGYEAGGPRTGPLVVALVKGGSGEHEDIYSGVKKLVRRNAGI